VRAVVASAGIHDVLTKSLGSSNKHNIVNATIEALRSLRMPAEFASKRHVSRDHIHHQSRAAVAAARGSNIGLGALQAEAAKAAEGGEDAAPQGAQ
jgi:small subunit ribosomal protein S5